MIGTKLIVLTFVFCICMTSAFAQNQPNMKQLSLDKCIETAVANNPRVNFALQGTLDARQKVLAKRGLKLPQLDFRTDALVYETLPTNKSVIVGGGTTDVYSSLNLSMLLFSNGRVEAGIDSATAQYLAANEQLRRARQDVAYEVSRSYYNILRTEALLTSRDEAVAQMEHYLKVAREMNDIGKAPMLDVLRAEVQLADVTQARLLALNQLEIARLELLNAMGNAEQGASVEPEKDDRVAPSYSKYDDLLAEALKIHPDHLRAQYLTKAALKDVKVAQAEYGSNLSLVANYNGEGSSLPETTNWNAGITFNIPLYNGGITKAKVGSAKAVVEQTKASAELIEQRISLAVRSAVLSTQDAANRLVTSQKSVEQAQEAMHIANEKYRVGLGSTTEVIDTQVALVKAQTNYTQALYDGKLAVALLEYAIGRDPVAVQTTAIGAEKENK